MNEAPDRTARRAGNRALLIATAIVVALVFATTMLGRIEPMTTTVALGSAALLALGTLIVAAMMAPRSVYPRWSWWGAAGVVTATLFASVAFAPSPEIWDTEVRSAAWLLPWMLALFGVTRQSRVCERSAKRGWVLVGATTVLAIVTLGASSIADSLKSLLA